MGFKKMITRINHLKGSVAKGISNSVPNGIYLVFTQLQHQKATLIWSCLQCRDRNGAAL